MPGNERPCDSCCKRGMALKCVDGFRKPPKYLFDEPPRSKKTGVRRTRPCRRQPQHEFIDPTLLQTSSPSPEHDSPQTEGRFWEEKNHAVDFSRKLQQSPWQSVRPEQSEQIAREESYQSPENVSEGLFSESLAIGTLIPPASDASGFDGHCIKEVVDSGSIYGFTISSGWSSTFFPCEVEEETEEQKVMAMTIGGTECANFLAWGQGMGGGNRATWLF